MTRKEKTDSVALFIEKVLIYEKYKEIARRLFDHIELFICDKPYLTTDNGKTYIHVPISMPPSPEFEKRLRTAILEDKYLSGNMKFIITSNTESLVRLKMPG